MGHGHAHGAAASLGSRHRGRLWAALTIALAVMVVEAAAAWYTDSLALLSDAAHVATDALGIGMALAAILAVRHGIQRRRRTFGLYRLEVLAALANTLLLFGVAIFVIVQAVRRFEDPPEIDSLPMLIAACIALGANITSLMILRAGARESINVRGAYFEVLGDALSSVGVILAAAVIWFTGWHYADSVLAAAVGLFILPRAWRLGRDALRILIQSAPPAVSVAEVDTALADIDGVAEIHDLHIWTLTSGMDVATVHLTLAEGADPQAALGAARAVLADRFGVQHSTVQVETPGRAAHCETLEW
jgi:cobalt-zinc-cadmium efflux system protein